MPTEKSDKRVQEKISQLDNLPVGFQLNSSARWAEIEAVLHPGKPKAIKWQYAAAILLGICLVPVLWKTSLRQPVAITKKENSASTGPQPAQTIHATIQQQSPVVNIIPARPILKKSKTFPRIKLLEPAINPVPQNNMVVSAPQPPAPAVNEPVTLTLMNPAVHVATKETKKPKRLKIIHLNELGEEQEILYTRAPLKKGQPSNEFTDELPVPQNYKPWWQPKPKPITTVTITDNP